MKSIQIKIFLLIISALLLCTVLVGGVGIISSQKIIDKNTEEYIKLLCKEQSAEIDGLFDKVAQSVDILAVNALEELESVQALSQEMYREEYTALMKKMIVTTTKHTQGAVASYLRYNPDYAPPTSGIFMEKNAQRGVMEEKTPTDLSLYTEDDVEYVGWYYIPLAVGEPVWMEPYQNKNIDIYMISYVIPLEKDGTTVGVIGMDIDFAYITDRIAKLKVFDSGYAYLENEAGEIVYHPILSRGETAEEQSDYFTAKQSLNNGMTLVITVPYAEINKERNRLIISILLAMIVLLAVFITVTYIVARSIVMPVKELSIAARQIAGGNLDVEIRVASKDEIGELAKDFRATVGHLKRYTEYINGLAYKDSLTGVKNKTAYDKAVEELQEEIKGNEKPVFAIAEFDVNDLKPVNDKYGHDSGNELIVNSCHMICKAFAHSPVFRIGGDEFVVILRGRDFEDREEIFLQIQKWMEETRDENNPAVRVSIAGGLAVFDPETDTCVADVYKRADAAMYENKRFMKSQLSKTD